MNLFFRIKRWLKLQKNLFSHAEQLNIVFDEITVNTLSREGMQELYRLLELIEDNYERIEGLSKSCEATTNKIESIESRIVELTKSCEATANEVESIEPKIGQLEASKADIKLLKSAARLLQDCVSTMLDEQKRTQLVLNSAHSGRNSVVIAAKNRIPQ